MVFMLYVELSFVGVCRVIKWAHYIKSNLEINKYTLRSHHLEKGKFIFCLTRVFLFNTLLAVV